MAGKNDTVNPVSNADLATQTANKKAQQQAEAARKKAEADAKKQADAETRRKNKEAEEHTRAQQKIANEIATAYTTGMIDEEVKEQLQENANNGIDLPAELPYKGSDAEKKFREQYMSKPAETTATSTPAKPAETNTADKPKKPKSANDYTFAEIEKMNGGDPDKIDEWLGNNPEYELLGKTRKALGPERLAKVEKMREENRQIKESSNIEQAKNDLVSGTEGEINAKADALEDKIDDSNNEYAKRLSDRVKEFTEGVNDHYIEGLPKGIWQQYKSGEYGYSKEQAQKELDKLHEGEITWSKKRRDYLLKHPELANEKERAVIDNYKKAKATLGYFALDAITTGLNNIAKSVKGDTNLDLSMSQKMNQTNLEKAIERRNEKYGTSQQNQWRSMIDSMDLSKEAKQKLQDIQIDRNFQKAFAKLDNETQKQALELMADWDFTPDKIAKVVAAKEMIKDDPDAAEAIIASMAGDLFEADGKTLDEKKVEALAKTLGTSVGNVMSGIAKGGIKGVASSFGFGK